jgi:hypothetical protein
MTLAYPGFHSGLADIASRDQEMHFDTLNDHNLRIRMMER